MPVPHRTFLYLFEDYKQNIFREWWQNGEEAEKEEQKGKEGRKEKTPKQKRRRRYWVMLVALIVLAVASLSIYFLSNIPFPVRAWISYALMLLVVVLSVLIATYVEKVRAESLDDEAQKYYEQKIVQLYSSLHEQDYDNRQSLAWIIQGCQEIIDQGCGLSNALERLKRYYITCILPILSFCAAAVLKDAPAIEQCIVALMGIGLLISVFALSQMVGPEIMEFASKRIRIAKELKEGAEYLLAQGDLEITEKPRAVLQREALVAVG